MQSALSLYSLRHFLSLESLEAEPETRILSKVNKYYCKVLSGEREWEVRSGGEKSQGWGLGWKLVSSDPPGSSEAMLHFRAAPPAHVSLSGGWLGQPHR